MFKKGYSSIRPGCTLTQSVMVVCLVVLAFSAAWATQHYYASEDAKKNKECKFKVVDEKKPKRKIEIKIKKGAINDYLKQEKIKKVKIIVEVEEELAACEEGTHYHLNITFEPSGTFFDPPLELKLTGDYVDTGCDVRLFDENGDPVPSRLSKSGDKITYFIKHFSVYDYGDGDYYP